MPHSCHLQEKTGRKILDTTGRSRAKSGKRVIRGHAVRFGPLSEVTRPCRYEVDMNSVALPASAKSQTLSAESDLIRQAARGNVDAFDELYRRHSQTAWRLAQAVALDRDSAAAAVGDGFSKALRPHRRKRLTDGWDDVFRPSLLAAVYRSAAERGHERIAAAPTARSNSKNAGTAFAEAAFRSLPERWRGAIWLSEVESL